MGMIGVIKSYYNGNGWIVGENGEEYFVHHSDLQMKEKHYKKGRKVTFDPVDKGLKHVNAVNVFVEVPPPPPPKERTGRGEWLKIGNGRKRCTDCLCTTDQPETPYCPHCGAVMHPTLPDNTVELMRRKDGLTPLGKWRKLEYGYRCSCCQLISAYPSMFCPRCGKWMEKFPKGSE